jgi:hypothetical protein
MEKPHDHPPGNPAAGGGGSQHGGEMTTEDVRRGAIAAIYKQSNRELAAEVDALRKLVRDLIVNLPTFYMLELIETNPLVKQIMGGSDENL